MSTRKISTIGLIGSEKAAIETTIDMASGFTIGRWQMAKDILVADVIVVDSQTQEGRKTLGELVNSGADQKSPIVIDYYSSEKIANATTSDAEIYLVSPLSYNNVTTFLKTIEVELKKPAHKRLKTALSETEQAESVQAPKPDAVQEPAEPIIAEPEIEELETPDVNDIQAESVASLEIRPEVSEDAEITLAEAEEELTLEDEPLSEVEPPAFEIPEIESPIVEPPVIESLELGESEEPESIVETISEEAGSEPVLEKEAIIEPEVIEPIVTEVPVLEVETTPEEKLEEEPEDLISEEIVLETPQYDTNLTQEVEQTHDPIDAAEETIAEDIEELYADTQESEKTKNSIDWLSEDEDDDEAFQSEPILTEVASPFIAETKAADKVDEPTTDVNDILSDYEDESLARTIPLSPKKDVSNDAGDFEPKSQLIGVIQKIIGAGETAQIRHKDYPLIRIFPDNGWFVFAEELDSYPSMYRDDSKSFEVEGAEEEIKDELFNGRLPQSLWKLIFTAALFGSDGRLFKHLHRSERFQLMHPPYFGMVPHTAEHISIAEYMVNNTENIETISSDLNIDVHTVIDFCNACDAIKLLHKGSDQTSENDIIQMDVAEVESDPTIESEVEREDTDTSGVTNKPGLINSLWSNLTKAP